MGWNEQPNHNLNGASIGTSTSSTNWGWTAGVGLEYAFWGGLSGRVEYDYIGLTNMNITVPPSATFSGGRYVHRQQPQHPDDHCGTEL